MANPRVASICSSLLSYTSQLPTGVQLPTMHGLGLAI